MTFLQNLRKSTQDGVIPEKLSGILAAFYNSYADALKTYEKDIADYEPIFSTLLKVIIEQLLRPYTFNPYHSKITHPFDYYTFGNDFIRPLIDLEASQILGNKNLDTIEAILKKGENVIFLANHQIEADPQVITILLERTPYTFGENIIYIAGERVLTDPLAAPFSKGRNLLCIFSKRHIENPPEMKAEKQRHNKKTIFAMQELLNEGSKCIYVAPSGGRDRQNEKGEIEISAFDPQSVELFSLMAKKATTPTHFFPLALFTYHILPPPDSIGGELGECRKTEGGEAHLYFGEEIFFDDIPVNEVFDKRKLRTKKTKYCWQKLKNLYKALTALSSAQ